MFPSDHSLHADPNDGEADLTGKQASRVDNRWRLRGKRAAVVLFSYYPSDPRPRRAAETLAVEGVTVDVICLQGDRSEPRREMINGIQVTRVPPKRRRGRKAIYLSQYTAFILQCFFFLTRRSLRRRYDLVHVHNMPDVLVFSALVPKLLGAKVVLDLHDPMPELMQTIFQLPKESLSVRLLKKLEKWSIAFADVVLTVNLATRKIYASRSCPAEKIKIVLNAPQSDTFSLQLPNVNGHEPAKSFTIMYHGSLVARNGFDLAVDALEKTRELIPNVRLLVCGERTSFFDEVMNSATKRGLADRIDYLGLKDRVGVAEVIRSCDVGVIPNHRNIFTEINTPTRIFEYLALGKPVIAPKSPGICDYFNDQDLIFFEPGNADDLARKVEFVYSHPAEVESVVQRGQSVYRDHQWVYQKSTLLDAICDLL
jgi:glycosyltransferase involved in cell wall biosynthesis